MRVNFFDLARMDPSDVEALHRRGGLNFTELIGQVAPLIDEVRTRGDEAVRELTKRFDGADMSPDAFRVPVEQIDRALQEIPDDLREAMEVSIANIRTFHERQVELPKWEIEISPGIVAGEKVVPLSSVGLYVPRGKGSFPSMMMMSGVPAKVAGVERIVVATPPDSDGKADPATLAAAGIIGLEEVYALGGVQAVAGGRMGERE